MSRKRKRFMRKLRPHKRMGKRLKSYRNSRGGIRL